MIALGDIVTTRTAPEVERRVTHIAGGPHGPRFTLAPVLGRSGRTTYARTVELVRTGSLNLAAAHVVRAERAHRYSAYAERDEAIKLAVYYLAKARERNEPCDRGDILALRERLERITTLPIGG